MCESRKWSRPFQQPTLYRMTLSERIQFRKTEDKQQKQKTERKHI